MKTLKISQECNECGKKFLVEYQEDGSYEYETEPCDCESDFSPSKGSPSMSQWLENLKKGKVIEIDEAKEYLSIYN